ncbi:MAG: response regulator [Candidatus Roizmanbacteria bacterium]|nr:response regulator [Candidatus Roizmanbacteria bacterium]
MSKRILIIDDDPGILEAISIILEEEGYIVDTEEKSEVSFTKINRFKPHLILLDILMSGGDGRIICKKIKKQKTTQHIPVILISAHPNAEASMVESGADGFLAKPFEVQDLLQMVSRAIPDISA